LGPPLAAPLFINFGVGWALAIDSASFIASFALILAIHAPPAARSVQPGEGGHAWQEFGQGLGFFARNRVLVTVLVTAMIVMFGAGALNVLDVFFVIQNLHASPGLYGWISAAFAGGALVGGITCSVLAKKLLPERLFWGGLLATGAGLLTYSRMTSFVPGLVLLFLCGLVVTGVNASAMPLILKCTPRDMLGRVSAVLNPAISLASVGSMAISAIIVSTALRDIHARFLGMSFGPVDTLFSVAGVMCFGAGLFAMVRLRQALPPAIETAPAAVS
jgi:Na+/melibiose symporter-like transporter